MDINWGQFNADLDAGLAKVTGFNLKAPAVSTVPGQLNAPVSQPAPQANQNLAPAGQRGSIPIMPEGFKFDLDQGKAASAKTPGDLVDAMKPASRREYMGWWEQQNGAINDQFNTMLQKLGQRPSDVGKLSRKEKFAALMDFGFQLMAASGSKRSGGQGNNLGAAMAVAAGNTVGGIENRRQGAISQFDQQAQAIETGRQGALKNLGTQGDAMKAQSQIDRDDAAIEKDRGYGNEVVDVEPLTSGLAGRTRSGNLMSLTDPITNKPAQPSANSPRANQSEYSTRHTHLTNMYIRGGANPTKAFDAATEFLNAAKATKGLNKAELRIKAQSMATQALGSSVSYRPSRNGGKSYSDAVAELTENNYSLLLDMATDSADGGQPPAANSPPVSALKPGQITKFKNGQSWSIDENGEPKRIK